MKTAIKSVVIGVLVLVFAQAHAQYELPRHTISSGGGQSAGGSFELTAAVAQHDSQETIAGNDFAINSGIMIPNRDLIFKNNLD
ncbi:hypothetical protein [Marinicella meishanensis]|uniref:hypothetical protein n=1 Tax=Marinicella meishanensis TaxID=2873263 RepID=UPI001CBD5A41|nr:hypothetical protein [Marinicella sp. NBU2979]